jgi:two-component system nitrate/nitrite response regulator NarL
LKAQHKDFRIVIFSDRFDLMELLTAIGSGADCYLLKHEVSPVALLQSLEPVLLGETIVPQGFTELIRNQVRPAQEIFSTTDFSETSTEYLRLQSTVKAQHAVDYIVQLPNREQLILLHLTQGGSNKQIARELKITEATVKTYVKALLHKIGVRNRTQAAMWAKDHLGRSHLENATSQQASSGLLVLLAQLGGRGLAFADQSPAAPQVRPGVHVAVGSAPPAISQPQRILPNAVAAVDR